MASIASMRDLGSLALLPVAMIVALSGCEIATEDEPDPATFSKPERERKMAEGRFQAAEQSAGFEDAIAFCTPTKTFTFWDCALSYRSQRGMTLRCRIPRKGPFRCAHPPDPEPCGAKSPGPVVCESRREPSLPPEYADQ